MSVPAGSNRVAYKEALVTALRATIAADGTYSAIPVFYGYPGDQLDTEAIIVGGLSTQGEASAVAVKPNGVYTDTFVVSVEVVAEAKNSGDGETDRIAADRRCEALVRLVQATGAVVSKRPALAGTTTNFGPFIGPDPYDLTSANTASAATVSLVVTTHLHPS